MARIILENIKDPEDLYIGLTAVFDSFGDDPRQFRLPEVRFSRGPDPEVEPVVGPARAFGPPPTEPRAFRSVFVACPNRGTHERLTDCALCWAEVSQGQASPVDVLTQDGLDAELRRLLGLSD